jgi:hypothetical protein
VKSEMKRELSSPWSCYMFSIIVRASMDEVATVVASELGLASDPAGRKLGSAKLRPMTCLRHVSPTPILILL